VLCCRDGADGGKASTRASTARGAAVVSSAPNANERGALANGAEDLQHDIELLPELVDRLPVRSEFFVAARWHECNLLVVTLST